MRSSTALVRRCQCDRNAGRRLGAADGDIGLDARHVLRGRKFSQYEVLKGREVVSEALQDVIALTRQHVGFPDDGPTEDQVFERPKVALGLAVQANECEGG